ncbi:hypothetical protein BRADO4516 [Bradyrhizobium sp. ORS 278]|uniref:DUF1127 domain-containing protein n=1 Tax=Bradyrhizobium sp. (strain ORS 278) TaxID=114615 RepID=UPI00015088A2|nr:DUF1127 domain-containing protein [Bradyrhizobium sp. ORS 278]CAL78254.1 hypothetical protein BRADO4516 [Bradyrhizobium sp. ORS 278]
MPPHTHLTAEIARDAAPLGLDRPIATKTIATKTNAARDVPTAPRPASVTLLREAAPEKNAAAPPGISGLRGMLAQLWHAFQDGRRLRRLRIQLVDLSETQLIDIGVNRADIEHIAAHRALEKLKDNTAHLMMSRGVM